MQPRRVFTGLLATILTALLASSADAASKSKRTKHAAPSQATSTCRGSYLFHCGPIYNSTDYLGNDPDPYIRQMIQRDLGAKYGGEN